MENFNYNGCLKGKYDIRDYKFKKKVAMSIPYPKEYICVNIPEVKNQGSVGSCVAHATSEILEFHSNCQHRLSTNFIYGIHNKLYNSEGPGMYLREACKIAKDYGDPEYAYCKGNDEVKAVYAIANDTFANYNAMNNAFEHRIKGFAKLGNETDIKYALLNYGPVLGAVTWYSDNKVIDGVLQKGKNEGGGHAIMIYGWNEVGYVCLNSWGKNWGNKGSFILPYDYKVDEAYSFIPFAAGEADIVKPTRNKFVDFIYKVVNTIVNIFKK